MIRKSISSTYLTKHLFANNNIYANQTFQQLKISNSFDANNKHKTLIQNITFSYVRIKDIQEIRQQYKQKGILKVISKSCGFFMKQAWHDFKTDYNIFQSIRLIPVHQRTQQQKYLYRKIKIDMIKFGPAFLIFNIPFGFPLFYVYLKLFPQLIPSWMMVDTINQQIVQKKEQGRINAWRFYQINYEENVRISHLKQSIFKQHQSLEDMRKIACICYGDYMDGTEYFSQKLGVEFKNGLISPKISLFLLKYQLKTQIEHDYELQNELTLLKSFEQRLFYKLERQISKLSL